MRHFVGREKEKRIFRYALTGESEKRVLLILDKRKSGKSYFLWHLQDICKDEGIPVALLDFQKDRDYLLTFTQFSRQLAYSLGDEYFPTILNEYEVQLNRPLVQIQTASGDGNIDYGTRNKFNETRMSNIIGRDQIILGDIKYTESEISAFWRESELMDKFGFALLKDLSKICSNYQPIVILIDSFEYALITTKAWICRWLLRPIDDKYQRLVVVVAGRPEEETLSLLESSHSWKDLVYKIAKFSPFSCSDIYQYFGQRHLSITDEALKSFFPAFRDHPLLFCEIADILEQEIGDD